MPELQKWTPKFVGAVVAAATGADAKKPNCSSHWKVNTKFDILF